MARSPRIAITTYGRNEKGRFTLPAAYVEAVRRAGGIPLLVPPGETRAEEVLEIADALVLAGGPDVDPARYGGARHPKLTALDPERDATEVALVRGAVAGAKPALCICRGMQVLNVALGGTLIEHVPDEVGEEVPHRRDDYVPHAVSVEEGSRLARVLGTTSCSPASSHHQALRRVADELAVVARAPDGIVEGVELRSHPFLLGVQWHPEHTAASDRTQQRLFDALVAATRG